MANYDVGGDFHIGNEIKGSIRKGDPSDWYIKSKQMDLHYKYGWLGRVFGAADSAPQYIAGTVCVFALFLSFISAGLILFSDSKETAGCWDFLNSMISVITACLGYLFGRASKNE